jgi:hypothetical protein
MVFGHGVWNDVFNYETFGSGHTLDSIKDEYSNCLISYWLAYERVRDLGNSDNEATDILNEVATPDCFDEGEDPVYGCTDPNANNYDPDATMEAIYNECRYDGCTDPAATNYDPNATDDDDSCEYDPETIPGCMDETANNYNVDATEGDGSCTYDVVGCMDETACNYDETANIDGEDCKYGEECGALDGLEDWHLIAGAILLVVLLK